MQRPADRARARSNEGAQSRASRKGRLRAACRRVVEEKATMEGGVTTHLMTHVCSARRGQGQRCARLAGRLDTANPKRNPERALELGTATGWRKRACR